MLQALKLHPGSSRAAVRRVEVDLAQPRPGMLALRYLATGAMDHVRIPAPTDPARAEGLWRHTCFEAFIGDPDGEAYREFNFSPSGQWAAYGFVGYRSGGHDIGTSEPPRLVVATGAKSLAMEVTLDLGGFGGLADDASWRLGLSAVIEDMDGTISYWALAHPPGKADFHHAAGFAVQLRAPEPS
jgi:hypothetical protein